MQQSTRLGHEQLEQLRFFMGQANRQIPEIAQHLTKMSTTVSIHHKDEGHEMHRLAGASSISLARWTRMLSINKECMNHVAKKEAEVLKDLKTYENRRRRTEQRLMELVRDSKSIEDEIIELERLIRNPVPDT